MRSLRLATCCALLLGAVAVSAAWGKAATPEQKLLEWVKSKKGAQVDMDITRDKDGLRGVIATKDFKEGDVIAKVPVEATIQFKDSANKFPAELAYELVVRMHTDMEFNKTYEPFLASQPGPDEVFAPEAMTDDHLAALQSPELERLARGQRDVVDLVFAGKYKEFQPLAEVIGEGKITLEQFKHISSLVGSRHFEFMLGQEKATTMLIPAIDMINHSGEPSAQRDDKGGSEFIYVTALKPIKKGEAVTHNYNPYRIHRPDMSLLISGFVEKHQLDKPLLCSIDLPHYDPNNPYSNTYANDISHEPKVGGFATAAERDRLAAILASLPTTEEEDLALLAGKGKRKVADWRERVLLEFRVARKKALRTWVEKLKGELESKAEL